MQRHERVCPACKATPTWVVCNASPPLSKLQRQSPLGHAPEPNKNERYHNPKGLVISVQKSTDHQAPGVVQHCDVLFCRNASCGDAIAEHLLSLGVKHSIAALIQAAACNKAPFDEKSLRMWAPVSSSTQL